MRLIITDPAGDAWGRLEPETSEEIVGLEQSAARGDWTIGHGTGAISELRALAARLGYPVRETEELACPSPKPRPATRGFEFGSAAWLHGNRTVRKPARITTCWLRSLRETCPGQKPHRSDLLVPPTHGEGA